MARSGMMLVAAVGVLAVAVTRTEALRVVAPSEGMTVVADRPYTVEWIGGAEDSLFEIDLHYCGSYSFCFDGEDDCGYYIADLTDSGDQACATNEEGCDVVMPEPLAGASGDGYRVRIVEVGTDNYRCSGDFYLMASSDAPSVGETGGPVIGVVEPNGNSVAVAGEAYTVEFDYDNGFGDRVGRFKIDLYKALGDGDCGTWSKSVCDKPNMGCHDTQGDYNILIPTDTDAGMYKVRVGLFGDDSVFACSEAFEIMPEGEDRW